MKTKLEFDRVERSAPAVVLYRLTGGLIGSPESYDFLEEIRAQAKRSDAPIVLNMEGLEQVNSTGVGILAACYTSVTNAGGKICLASVPKRLKTILDVVRLTDVLCVLGGEEEAIREVTSA
ncbi:MAG: STAS domain-containing protein [Candidatus Latescibacteria bacterium]|nr:STAS domain-containing protein [Candidatus Latescibacterota bacterium]